MIGKFGDNILNHLDPRTGFSYFGDKDNLEISTFLDEIAGRPPFVAILKSPTPRWPRPPCCRRT
jgi:hypothetical protein